MKDIIAKRRKELGLTQQELANKLFVSDKVVSKWETGKSIPDTSILVKLSEVLNISLDELLKNTNHNNEETISSDKAMLHIKNNLIIAISLEILSLIFTIFGRIIQFNYGREKQTFIIIFYVIAIILFIISIVYFLLSKNKMIIEYSLSKNITNKYISNYINITSIIIAIASVVFVFTIETIKNATDFLNMLIVLLIIIVIEMLIWFLIHSYLKKKK